MIAVGGGKDPVTPVHVVRVFISSTFHDMQSERDELSLRVFPELRARCRERGISLIDVDLRWGITEEQEIQGDVLPLCLEQIDKSRPFFVGLLGERYGTSLPRIEERLLNAYPWLRFHADCSLTEIEFLHGALLNVAAARHAFFYFRSPKYVAQLPDRLHPRYLENDPARVQRLLSLKQRVREAGFPVVDGYTDPASLADRVLEDLWSAIDRLPEAQAGRNASEAPARGSSSFLGDAYIERPEEEGVLTSHILESGGGFGIVGSPGVGKSTLLAAWTRRFEKAHPEYLVFEHYFGDLADGSDTEQLVRRLVKRLHLATGGSEANLPEMTRGQRQTVDAVIRQAAEQAPLLLVLDGLDQLMSDGEAPDLSFLPGSLPPGVTVIGSMRPGQARSAVERRGWRIVSLGALSADQRHTLIISYLARWGKQLDPERRRRIAEHSLAGNPLFLSVLVEQLRVGALHEELDDRIAEMARIDEPVSLFAYVLTRLEHRLEAKHPGMLETVMRLLWVSRRGLQENELVSLLGGSDTQTQQRALSILLLALQEELTQQSGYVALRHAFVREAVRTKYVPSPREAHEARNALVAYHQVQDGYGVRRLEELPWQLHADGRWDELKAFLEKPIVFQHMWKYGMARDLASYFGPDAPYDLTSVLWASLEQFEREASSSRAQGDYAEILGRCLCYVGKDGQSSRFFEHASKRLAAAFSWDSFRVAACLQGAALGQIANKDYAAATSTIHRALALLHRCYGVEHEKVARGVMCLAMARAGLEDPDAMWLFRRALELTVKVRGSDHPDTAIVLDNMAGWLKTERDPVALHREALRIAELRLGPDHEDTAKCLDNLANALIAGDEIDEAEELARRALGIWEMERGEIHPDTQVSLSILQTIAFRRGDLAGGTILYRRSLRTKLLKSGGDFDRLTSEVALLGNRLNQNGFAREAELLLRDFEGLVESAGVDIDRLILNELASALFEQGSAQDSGRIYERALSCQRSSVLSDARTRSHSLMGLARVARDQGETERVYELLNSALHLCRSADDTSAADETECLNLMAQAALATGDVETADALSLDALRVARTYDDRMGGYLGTLYDLRNRVLAEQGDLAGAEQAGRSAVEVLGASAGEDHPNTLSAVHNLGIIRRRQGDLDEAERLLERAVEARTRVLGERHPATANSLRFLAAVRGEKGAHEASLEAGERAARIRDERKHPDSSIVAEDLWVKAESLGALGKHDEAEKAYEAALDAFQGIGDGARVAACMTRLGRSREHQENLKGAEQAYRNALLWTEEGPAEQMPGVRTAIRLAAIQHLARVLAAQGELEETETLIRRALAIAEDESDPVTAARWQMELAGVFSALGDHERALPIFERCAAFFRASLEPDDVMTTQASELAEVCRLRCEAGPGAQISSLLDVGEMCLSRRNAEGAERWIRRALEICEETLNCDDPLLGRTLSALGSSLSLTGRVDEAEAAFRRAIEIVDDGSTDMRANAMTAYSNLAFLLARKGSHEEAASLFRDVVAFHEREFGLGDARTRGTVVAMVKSLIQIGGNEEAIDLLLPLVHAHRNVFEAGAVEAVPLYFELISAVKDQFSAPVAGALLGRIHEYVPRESRIWPLIGGHASDLFARVCDASGRREEAIHHFEGVLLAVDIFLKPSMLDSETELPELPLEWAAHACLYLALFRDRANGAWDKALTSYRLGIKLLRRLGREVEAFLTEFDIQAMRQEAGRPIQHDRIRNMVPDLESALFGTSDPEFVGQQETVETAVMWNDVAVRMRNLGLRDEAEALFRRALLIDERLRSPDDPKLPHRLNNLCTVLVMHGKLAEAKSLCARAWRLKAGHHDITSTRILVVRVAIALLEAQSVATYLGQLKTLLTGVPLQAAGDIVTTWDIGSFLNSLRPALSSKDAELLAALVAALNDRRKAADLDGFAAWHEQRPVSLEADWRSR